LPFPAAISHLPAKATDGHRQYEAALTSFHRLNHGAVYNLLATRRWLMIVPRTRECFEDISINSLGFAGSLFLKDAEQLSRVRAAGPVRMLQSVTA
ncbi:MAG: phosphorylase, partial [Myxococcaceae bacterium]